MSAFVVTVFLLVYLGMILGGLPFLKLDRTGVALLGAIALEREKGARLNRDILDDWAIRKV